MKNDKDNKSPGFWFYPGDYERDVQVLSLAAQGLWMRMLCWAGINESHRGFVELQSGEPMTEDDISAKAGRPIKAVRECLIEMRRAGIFSVDSRGCIFNRRMAREFTISFARKNAADSRWERARLAARLQPVSTDFAYAKDDAKDMQKCPVTASVLDSVSDTDETSKPICASDDAGAFVLEPPINGNGHERAKPLREQEPAEFAAFWELRWRPKDVRERALGWFRKRATSPDLIRLILSEAERQRPERLNGEPQYRPMMSTWLKDKSYIVQADPEQLANPVGRSRGGFESKQERDAQAAQEAFERASKGKT